MRTTHSLILSVLLVFAVGCEQTPKALVAKAERYAAEQDYESGLKIYLKAYESAREDQVHSAELVVIIDKILETYRLYDPKSPDREKWYLIKRLKSDDFVSAQKEYIRYLAEEKNDDKRVISESQKTLSFDLSYNDRCEIVYYLSSSLLQEKQIDSAASELEVCLGNIPIDKKLSFKLRQLELDILSLKQEWLTLLDRTRLMIESFPEFNSEHQLEWIYVNTLEQLGKWEECEEWLRRLGAEGQLESAYVQFRLRRIEFKKQNSPGARLRKTKN